MLFIAFVLRFVVLGRSPKQGVLKITTNVTSRVLLENRELGRTPFEEKVATGEYTLKLIPEQSSTGYASWQGKIVIGPNFLTYVNRDLSESELTSAGETLWLEKVTSNKAELTILSVPDGANVLFDDQSKGVTPISLTDLPQGDHTLVLTSPGFEPRTMKVKLTSGYRLTSSVFLALSPTQVALATEESATAAARLNTTPPAPTTKLGITPTKTPIPTSKATPTPTQASQQAPKKIKVTDTPTGFLRVRKDPSTQAQVLGQVNPGDIFMVVDTQTVSGTIWYKIPYTESQMGWISGQYTEKVE